MLRGKEVAIVADSARRSRNGKRCSLPVQSAEIGHIDLYRDEETHEPHEYFCKLPNPIEQRTIKVSQTRCFRWRFRS